MLDISSWSTDLRKKFVKNKKIPITIFDEPYFSYYFHFFDRQYDCVKKAEVLSKELNGYVDENEYFHHTKELSDRIIHHIRTQPTVTTTILNTSINKYTGASKNIYQPRFCNKNLMSIDLACANFQSIKLDDPYRLDNCDNWLEFVSQFTDDEYFKSSKQSRQYIFGNLDPRRQQRLQKAIMQEVADLLSDDAEVLVYSSDELVIETSLKEKEINEKIDSGHSQKLDYRIENFNLEEIKTKAKSIYKRNLDDGTFQLKCCQPNYVAEVLRHIYKEPLHEYDRLFINENRLCEYKDGLF